MPGFRDAHARNDIMPRFRDVLGICIMFRFRDAHAWDDISCQGIMKKRSGARDMYHARV